MCLKGRSNMVESMNTIKRKHKHSPPFITQYKDHEDHRNSRTEH